MMRSVDLMIFDLDGTLVSSGHDLASAVNYTLGKMGLPLRKESEIIGFVGDGIRKLLERALNGDRGKMVEEALIIFSDYYARHLLDTTALYPGVLDVLDHFAEKKKAVLTNKRQIFTKAILSGLKIEKYFNEIIGADTFSYQKPDARLVSYLLDKYGIAPQRAVIIGDGVNDILTARNSGILSVAVLSGLGRADDLLAAGADYVCENIAQLKTMFI